MALKKAAKPLVISEQKGKYEIFGRGTPVVIKSATIWNGCLGRVIEMPEVQGGSSNRDQMALIKVQADKYNVYMLWLPAMQLRYNNHDQLPLA